MAEDIVIITFKTEQANKEWLQSEAEENHRSMTGQLNFIIEQAQNAKGK